MLKVRKIPSARRLPVYLQRLNEMRKAGADIVATPELARYMGCAEVVVRKDLAITGIAGQPGVGYRIGELIDAIRNYFGWNSTSRAILVGAGSLGSALLGYEGFEEYGLHIVAAFDADPGRIGTTIHEREVFSSADIQEKTTGLHAEIGIICVPPAHAQDVADRMIAGGIKAIWNFANVALNVPADVVVQRELIAGGLAALSLKMKHKLDQEQQATIEN